MILIYHVLDSQNDNPSCSWYKEMYKSTNSYQLKQEDDDYIFSITLLEESIKLTCEDSKGQIYSKTYSLEEIKSLDQYFANIQSNFDVIDTFDNILKNEKVRVEIESGVL